MRPHILTPESSVLVLAALALLAGSPAAQDPGRAASEDHPFGPGAVPVDDFRADGVRETEPVRGGRVVVHVPTRPLHLNAVIASSADTRRILEEVHARLVDRDWETWEHVPSLASSYRVDDLVVVRTETEPRELYGRSERTADGWRLTPVAPDGTEAEPVELEPAAVERVEAGAVFTFHLRDDVRWHDGHPFDARDVVFTLRAYLAPEVQSEHARHRFEQLRAFEALDDHTVRVVFERSYFLALDLFEDDLVILPSHLYDITDPDHADHDPDATPARRAAAIHENPANTRWVGLGPYRVTEWNDRWVEATRFDDYFDPANGGYVDSIRWRIITDDNPAKQALLAGELDFFGRLRSRELLGEFCAQPAFAEQFEKGTYYTPQMNYVAWNLRRPLFGDRRVRVALAHCFDWQEFIDTIGSGMGRRVTASWYRFSPNYDATLEPYPFDLDRAEELLAEAGWYDRDGDGVLDKDGVRFEFEYLYSKVDATMRLVGLKLKENLERIGVVMNLASRDFATRQELVGNREFDAAAGSWIFGAETDPMGLWHSSRAGLAHSNNASGYADPESDRLIEALRREPDDARRRELFHALQRRIHAAQPYMFGCLFPTKFAVSKRVRGVQRFFLDPGYSVRRWYVEPEAVGDTRSR